MKGSTNDTTRGHDHGKPVEVMETCNQVTMDAIDHTIKNYTDNLLHVLQNVSERLSQLENTVQGLEHTIAGIKSAEGEKLDQSNSRLSKLELLIAEVCYFFNVMQAFVSVATDNDLTVCTRFTQGYSFYMISRSWMRQNPI